MEFFELMQTMSALSGLACLMAMLMAGKKTLKRSFL